MGDSVCAEMAVVAQMRKRSDGECREALADLPETFNCPARAMRRVPAWPSRCRARHRW